MGLFSQQKKARRNDGHISLIPVMTVCVISGRVVVEAGLSKK
jgi:hypothetical protein